MRTKKRWLPAVRTNGKPPATATPVAAMLQEALAEIMTAEKWKGILRQAAEEAETGAPAEKHRARQFLANLAGAKSAAPPAQYIQQNFYAVKKGGKNGNGKTDKRARDTLSLIVRYLDHEGPSMPEIIAAEIVRPASEVRAVLAANGDRFERLARNGAAWSLKTDRHC